jgi:hypothetical protein
MGDITIGPGTPTPAPGTTPTGAVNPSSKTQKDSSLDDAKGVGLDFGKSFGSELWSGLKKDRSTSLSFEKAIEEATKDVAKTAIKVFTTQFASDPTSHLGTLLQASGDGYFTPGQHDIFSKPPAGDADPHGPFDPIKDGDGFPFFTLSSPQSGNHPNPGDSNTDAGKDKPKGFDWSIGFPKLSLSPKGSVFDLIKKPSPANIKEITVGEKVELSYGTKTVSMKLTVEAEGTQTFQGVKGWKGLDQGLLLKQGQGSASLGVGVTVHPTPDVSVSLEGGVQASSKLTGPDNQRTNSVGGHVGLQLSVMLPGGTNAKKEELLRNESKPKEKSFEQMAPSGHLDQVERFVEGLFPTGDIGTGGK